MPEHPTSKALLELIPETPWEHPTAKALLELIPEAPWEFGMFSQPRIIKNHFWGNPDWKQAKNMRFQFSFDVSMNTL